MRRILAPGSTACPRCKQIGLVVENRFKPKDSKVTYLSSDQSRVAGRFTPYLECQSNCGWSAWGETEPGYVVFALDTGEDKEEEK